MNCSVCKQPNREDARYCNKCGASLDKTCPKCQTRFARDKNYCPSCGWEYKVATLCQYCNEKIFSGQNYCPTCGKSTDRVVCPKENCRSENFYAKYFCSACGTALATKPTSVSPYGTGGLPPSHILNNQYRIEARIAFSEMSAVYRAVNINDPKVHYAIKEMSYHLVKGAGEEEKERLEKSLADQFQREYDILHNCKHPYLVKALDKFEEGGHSYIAMEYIDGKTLAEILHELPRGKFIAERDILAWARQICSALNYLHNGNIVYRDMKPANLMLETGSNCIKIIDFGIARFYVPSRTTDTEWLGTQIYQAPELENRSQSDRLSDIYALGVTLYQLFTRQVPDEGSRQFRTISSIRDDVSPMAEQAVMKAISLQRQQRQQTVSQFAEELLGEPLYPYVSDHSTDATQDLSASIADAQPADRQLGQIDVQPAQDTAEPQLTVQPVGQTLPSKDQAVQQDQPVPGSGTRNPAPIPTAPKSPAIPETTGKSSGLLSKDKVSSAGKTISQAAGSSDLVSAGSDVPTKPTIKLTTPAVSQPKTNVVLMVALIILSCLIVSGLAYMVFTLFQMN